MTLNTSAEIPVITELDDGKISVISSVFDKERLKSFLKREGRSTEEWATNTLTISAIAIRYAILHGKTLPLDPTFMVSGQSPPIDRVVLAVNYNLVHVLGKELGGCGWQGLYEFANERGFQSVGEMVFKAITTPKK